MIQAKSISVIVFFLLAFSTFGMEETYSVRRGSSYFSSDFAMVIVDGRFNELGSGAFVDRDPELLVKFGVEEREYYGFINTYASLTLNIIVDGYDEFNVLQSSQSTSLTISYSPDGSLKTIDMAYFKTSGFHKYVVRVSALTGFIPENIYIESELTIDRYYEISETDLPTVGSNYVLYNGFNDIIAPLSPNNGAVIPTGGQELEIWWDYIPGADEYELEWTWVDNYGSSSTQLDAATIPFDTRDFELNNTRIITKAQRYRIPLIYAKGYLIYRVRGIGRWTDNGLEDTDIRKFGPWSSGGPSIQYISDWPNYVKIDEVHEALKNWQYQAVYAEGGKKKDIISYFDGSLRNRQTVTRINSNNQAIVGENIYDNQGRVAIQILPTPVAATALKYYSKLNLNLDGLPYSHRDFDWEPVTSESCTVSSFGMSTASGASQYYSASASNNNWQDYVPDAGTFPFVQVEYTPDNTGRIRSQSGVGPTYQMAGSHATKYFYLQPTQEELNRLFGYEVGYKTRYKKNLVVDANGQVSISYIDPQGRVIATSLAGTNSGIDADTKTNLLSLPEEINGNHAFVTRDLLNKFGVDDPDNNDDDNTPYVTGNNGPIADALGISTQYASTDDNSPHNFTYRVRTSTFSDICTGAASYPFAYNLKINVTDDCGQTMLDDGPINVSIAGTNPGDDYLSSTTVDQTFNFDATLNTGAYSVHKIITIDNAVLQQHLDHYLANNSCILSPEAFYESTTDCFDEYPEGSVLDALEVTTCVVTQEMMLGDFNPGGQYGKLDGNPLSIFSDNNVLSYGGFPTDVATWKNPSTPYVDMYGVPSLIEVHEVGSFVFDIELDPVLVDSYSDLTPGALPGQYFAKPEQLLHVADFISEWDPTWANSFLVYHPENCYLTYLAALCDGEYSNNAGTMSTETYDTYLRQISTYEDAVSAGLNDFGLDMTAAQVIRDQDPYFNLSYSSVITAPGANTLKGELMTAIMENYKGTNLTLWEFSVKSVVCGTDLAGTCTIPSSISGLSVAQQNQIWKLYREYYIAEKKKINQVFMDIYAISSNCYNGFIGEETPNTPSITGFVYYPELTIPGYPGGSATTILSLYFDAITSLGTDPFPWTLTPFSALFADSEKRVIPIDNLYDNTVPEDVLISEMQDEVDAINYYESGRCDLSFDLEYFLDAMAKNNLLTTAAVPSTSLPQFTADLYLGMQGSVPNSTEVFILTSISGSQLNITATGPGGLPLACGTGAVISLAAPLGLDWLNYNSTWSVMSMSTLYYVPGSFSTYGSYHYQIIAEVNDGGDIYEVVLNGTTCVQIGECNYEPTGCERDENFGNDLVAVFSSIYDGGVLTNAPINDVAGSWYSSSELLTQLDDSPSLPGAVVSTDGSSEFTITNASYSIHVELNESYSATNIAAIMGAIYNPTTLKLTIYYVDNAGQQGTFIADVSYFIGATANVPDLVCSCIKAEDEIAIAFENLVNYLLVDYHEDGINLPLSGFDELSSIDPFIVQNAPLSLASFEFNSGSTNATMSFGISGGNSGVCLPTLVAEGVTDLTSLQHIYNTQVIFEPGSGIIGFTATGVLANGNIVFLKTQDYLSCFDRQECAPCIPSTVAPLSCNAMWDLYEAELSDLNDAINLSSPGEDLFPIISEPDFCETELAYLVNDYLYYLSVFGITNPDDDKFISIAAFGNTNLNFGYTDLNWTTENAIVDAFLAYQATDDEISWGNFVNLVYLQGEGINICPPAPMLNEIDGVLIYPCEQLTANINTVNASNQYEIYLQNMAENFKQRYVEEAIASLIENFDASYDDKEYHYTLYYYDQAGNLIQTVPPKGVDRIDATINEDAVKIARLNNDQPENTTLIHDVIPEHTYQTIYSYNSLNQLTKQSTPDGGTSQFGYDQLGRLVVSQNAKQQVEFTPSEQFSYTRYDDLGRIVEVGEMTITGNFGFNENGKFVNGSALVDVSALNFPENIAIPGTIDVAREEVTLTIYDAVLSSDIENLFEDYADYNTRNRITGVLYFDVLNNSINIQTDYTNATFYDYDVHGNVKEVIQDIRDVDLVALGHNIKKTKYEYDLVSGNVIEVAYQKDEIDQFKHRYNYDADNRITNVETSHDDVVWEQDAKYFYYDHGPLARTEIGDKKVQASDFAYTVQGWLKGVNSENLDLNADQGRDGKSGNINRMNAKDVYGYSLHYFDGDYQARVTNDFLAYSNTTTVTHSPYNLYNGNIKEMYTANSGLDEEYLGTNHTSYRYDQLNRIISMDQQLVQGTSITNGQYASTYSYDQNGNLLTLTRNAPIGPIDNLSYHYTGGTNRLKYVSDPLGSVLGDDLGNQVPFNTDGDPDYLIAENYGYDQIGQLIQDKQSDIQTIEWKVTGKVSKIIREPGSTDDDIVFTYDAMGNRIIKAVYNNNGVLLEKTYYFSDAQGNCMSIYTLNHAKILIGEPDALDLSLAERNIYGSSRVGVENVGYVIASTDLSNVNFDEGLHQVIGDKRYELSNHLGNVLEVITDRKLTEGVNYNYIDFESPLTISGTSCPDDAFFFESTAFDDYTIVTDGSGNNYYQTGTAAHSVQYSIHGATVGQTYTISADILSNATSFIQVVVYNCATGANVSTFYTGTGLMNIDFIATNANMRIKFLSFGGSWAMDNLKVTGEGLTEHVEYLADVVSYSDYYPFGWQLPGRNGSFGIDDYRYSFQGQEKDDEVKDIKGGSINYKYRMHDPRVGRFFAIDPLARKYPHYTPYSFSGNKVIAFVELEGLEEIEPVVPQYGPVLENEAPEILLPEVFDGYQKMLDDWKKNGLYPAPEELDNEQLEAPDFDEWLKIFDIDMNSPEWNTNPAEMQRQYNFAIDMYNSVIDLVNARRMAENARRINSEFGVTPLLPLLEKKLKLIETPDLDFELDIPDEVPPGDPIPIESIPPPSEELLAISEEKNTNNTKE